MLDKRAGISEHGVTPYTDFDLQGLTPGSYSLCVQSGISSELFAGLFQDRVL